MNKFFIALLFLLPLQTLFGNSGDPISVFISTELAKIESDYKKSLVGWVHPEEGWKLKMSKETYIQTKTFLNELLKSTNFKMKKSYVLSELHADLQWEEGTLDMVGDDKDLKIAEEKINKLKTAISKITKLIKPKSN
jgi:hypothetical protein